MITSSGGEYAYLFKAYGGIPAYLYAWTSIVVIKTSSVAIICLAFADYTLEPMFDDCGPPVFITKMLTAVAISKTYSITEISFNKKLPDKMIRLLLSSMQNI